MVPGGWGLGVQETTDRLSKIERKGSQMEPALQSLTRLLEHSCRLHEKGADAHRLRQYVQRWVSWLHGGLQGAVTENRFNQIWNYVNLKLSG